MMLRLGWLVAWACLVGSTRGDAHPAEVAIFAGGCFWCLEAKFEAAPGVVAAEPGYIGGWLDNPTDREVATQTTGHYEAVRVTFDPTTTSYRRLLIVYWLNVDPTNPDGQFCERGASKRTAIFVTGPEQERAATALKERAESVLRRPVVTPILPATTFWLAEPYHQDYARRNPLRYDFYQRGCGREAALLRIWGARPMLAADP